MQFIISLQDGVRAFAANAASNQVARRTTCCSETEKLILNISLADLLQLSSHFDIKTGRKEQTLRVCALTQIRASVYVCRVEPKAAIGRRRRRRRILLPSTCCHRRSFTHAHYINASHVADGGKRCNRSPAASVPRSNVTPLRLGVSTVTV